MTDIRIQLSSTQELMRFNRIITRYECDFDLEVGHSYIDAKSLLGLYSLSLQRPMILHIQAEGEMLENVIEELEEFVYMDDQDLAYEY